VFRSEKTRRVQLTNCELRWPGRSKPSLPVLVSARRGGAGLKARSSRRGNEASVPDEEARAAGDSLYSYTC
jgi:hypothetical protein